jgi:NAD(P)-dependent dehydrogenase (short-subunit alcohol dehydrogenase family)
MPKTILVTGGSRGIGRAVALRAGALGWSVAVGYREDRTAAEAVVTAVEEVGGRAVALEGDVAAEADVVATFGDAQAALGPLDGVVVNAGIVGPPSPLADMPVERVRRTIDVNVLGTLLCAREAARCLAVSRGAGEDRSCSSRRPPRGWARRTSPSTTRPRRVPSTRSASGSRASWPPPACG